jgi:hypothetical protein
MLLEFLDELGIVQELFKCDIGLVEQGIDGGDTCISPKPPEHVGLYNWKKVFMENGTRKKGGIITSTFFSPGMPWEGLRDVVTKRGEVYGTRLQEQMGDLSLVG